MDVQIYSRLSICQSDFHEQPLKSAKTRPFSEIRIFTSMKIALSLLLLLLIGIGVFACRSKQQLPVVSGVDLNRYQGRWYDIASIPLRFSQYCTCTFAEYTADANGKVIVFNQCLNSKTGKTDSIRGKAFPVKGSNNAKLKVQFFWPFRGDYYIIDLDSNYSLAMVGSPDRSTLWILSRTPVIPETRYQDCMEKAKALGFDTSRLRRTPQQCYTGSTPAH
jgi:apolipoprotein D and lipocalin family protein